VDFRGVLEQFGAIWSNLEQFGAIWSNLEQFGAIWSNLFKLETQSSK